MFRNFAISVALVLSQCFSHLNGEPPRTVLLDPVPETTSPLPAETNLRVDLSLSGTEPPRTKTLFAWNLPSLIKAEDRKTKEEETQEDRIATDRPDFTESSRNVGRGRVQVEMGYTYSQNRDEGVRGAHSFPEMLLRFGVFADWLEIRVGQNFGLAGSIGVDGGAVLARGAEDLYFGIGLGLTEQLKFLPESRLLIQSTMPTGAETLTSGRALPGLNYLYGWEITDSVSLGGSSQLNAAINSEGKGFIEMAQALTVSYSLTKKLGAYTEWFAFFPQGDSDTGNLHYIDGGFTYKLTPNFQLDIRAGVGLSRQADDFFVGTGFAVRR